MTESTSKVRIAVIGAGRMGSLRARAAESNPECEVVQVIDNDAARAETLAQELDCESGVDWHTAIRREDIDAVVVSTTHDVLAQVSLAAVRIGKHLFCEKPMARTPEEAQPVVRSLAAGPVKAVIGFTLRHHPAILKAHEMLLEGAIGQPFYVRGVYGHGGRPGYDKEWRMDPQLGGGGELLDQGVHLIDLSRWFLGELVAATGEIGSYYWTGSAASDSNEKESFATESRKVEDNAFALLRNQKGQVAFLHASWTQWKNKFLFEVFGRDGSLSINGLGGSYGEEQLLHAVRSPRGGAPEMRSVPLENVDVWQREIDSFVDVVQGRAMAGEGPSASARDGLETLRIVQHLYLQKKTGLFGQAAIS